MEVLPDENHMEVYTSLIAGIIISTEVAFLDSLQLH